MNGIKQLKVEVTRSMLSINFIERVKNVWVIAINTMVYFIDPKRVFSNEGIRLLKSNWNWDVDDLLTKFGWSDWHLSANFGWD